MHINSSKLNRGPGQRGGAPAPVERRGRIPRAVFKDLALGDRGIGLEGVVGQIDHRVDGIYRLGEKD